MAHIEFVRLVPGMRTARDLLAAVGYLAWARHRLSRITPGALARNQPNSDTALSLRDVELAKRIGRALSRASSRVPWRSDCLVQALAAERWLGAMGVPTVLCIGARKDERSQYHFHAWVKAGSFVVTGGEIDAYAPLLGKRGLADGRD